METSLAPSVWNISNLLLSWKKKWFQWAEVVYGYLWRIFASLPTVFPPFVYKTKKKKKKAKEALFTISILLLFPAATRIIALWRHISNFLRKKDKKQRQNILTIFGMSSYIDHAQILAVGTTVLDKPPLSAAVSILLVKTNVFISFATALKHAAEETLHTKLKPHKSNHSQFYWNRKIGKYTLKKNPFCWAGLFEGEKNKAFGSN